MYSKEKLEQILNEKILSIEETNFGITNKNYIITTNDNKYFYRTAKDSTKIVDKDNEKEAINTLKEEPYFLKPKFYNNDNLITSYQKNSKTFSTQRNLSNIVKIGKLLHKFHSKEFQVKNTFNPISMFERYFEAIENPKKNIDNYLYLIDEFKKNYTPDRLCHNDLVEGNFLFSKDNIYLIDFEYAGLNDYYFDIASFISENDLDYQETITFLKSYFNNEKCDFKKLDIFLKFCDLLWYTWSTLLYQKRHEEIYNEISIKKYESLKKPRKILY